MRFALRGWDASLRGPVPRPSSVLAVKCLQPNPRLLIPAVISRNGWRDCNRVMWLTFLGKKWSNVWLEKDKWCMLVIQIYSFFLSLSHEISKGLKLRSPERIMSAPRRCRWRSGSGCGSSAARWAPGSAAGSAGRTVDPWPSGEISVFTRWKAVRRATAPKATQTRWRPTERRRATNCL